MTSMADDENQDRSEYPADVAPGGPAFQEGSIFQPRYLGDYGSSVPVVPAIADEVLERRSDQAVTDAKLTTLMLAVMNTGSLEAWVRELDPTTTAFAFSSVLRHIARNRP